MRGVIIENGVSELVDDLEVRDVGPHEVRVGVRASGLCRSDLLLEEYPDPRPTVRGHEAAGIIKEVGAEVTGLAVGQRVAVTCQRPCMSCAACEQGLYTACPTGMDDPEAPFRRGGREVRSFARSSSLAEQIVVDELQVHPIDDGTSLAGAALLGCAVSTGAGMARNVAGLRPGQSVAVFGVGGIGINSIQAARSIGASRIVAVDVNPGKEGLARDFGATDFVRVDPGASAEETAALFLEGAGGPVDAVIEATGFPGMIATGLRVLAIGGTLAQVGIPAHGGEASFDVTDLMMRHLTIRGALNGATDPFTDPAEFVAAAERGDLELDEQITHRFPLERYEEAFAALKSGEALRVVVDVAE